MRQDFSVWFLTINVQCARGIWYLDYVQFSGILYTKYTYTKYTYIFFGI